MKLPVLLALTLAACNSNITANAPAITATQQLIVSSAEEKSISSLSFSLPRDKRVYVDTTEYTGSKYQLALFQTWLLNNGSNLTNNQKLSDITVQVYSSVDSYNYKSLLIGVPTIKLGPFLDTPELAAYGKNTMIAINQFAYTAYDTSTGKYIASATSKYGVQTYSITKMGFVGSRENPKLENIIR